MTTLLTPDAYMALLVERARAADAEMHSDRAAAGLPPVPSWLRHFAARVVSVYDRAVLLTWSERRRLYRECLGVRTNACPSTLGPQLKRPPLVRQHQEFGGLTPTKEGL